MIALTPLNGILIRMGLYLLIFWPIVGYYVYVKSKEQNLSNPRVRGVVLGFFGILGLVIHLWLSRERRES